MKIICPIRPRNFKEFKNLVSKINNRADIIEVWIDQVSDDFFKKFKTFEKGKMKFLAVCKQIQEKGHFVGNSIDRVEQLKKFLLSGGRFVDLDITQNKKEAIEKIDTKKLILSFHDFNGVSDNLKEILQSMRALNPVIYKFAVTVNTRSDLDKFMAFIQKFPPHKKAIFTTMGKFGKEGRKQIGEKSWGQFFALDKESTTASGQRTVEDIF